MKIKRRLSWHAARTCWKKYYRGKTFYLGKGKCSSEEDWAGYEIALQEWLRLKDQIDRAQLALDDSLRELDRQREGDTSGREFGEQRYTSLIIHGQSVTVRVEDVPSILSRLAPQSGETSGTTSGELAGFATNYENLQDLPEVENRQVAEVTISDGVDAYCLEYRRSAERGEVALVTFAEQRCALDDIVGFASRFGKSLLRELDSHLLRNYRNVQLSLIASKDISAYTAKRRLRILRRFLQWAYRAELVREVPRFVDGEFASVDLPSPEPHPFTREEIRGIFGASLDKGKFSRKSRKTALYVLLGLNCGYRSGDIASLTHEHLDLANKAIVRRRQKTGSAQVHRLWDCTFDLLRDEMSNPENSKLLLLSERGEPLVKERLDKKTLRLDAIGRSFGRAKDKAKIKGPNKGHSSLRDTGATWLKEQGHAEVVRSLYLGHKNRSVESHYSSDLLPVSSPFYAPLFDALGEMDDYYALGDLL